MSGSRSVMLVARHAAAEVPDDGFYVPIHVGAALSESSFDGRRDDDGPNISEKNASYCELTAIYWAWRNLDADVVGLSHYRRYFHGEQAGPDGSRILSAAEADATMADYDVLVARPRDYYIESVESHYRHAHVGGDLTALRSALSDVAPESLPAYDDVMSGRRLSLYNMSLMRREQFDVYAEWLFAVLAEAERRIDNAGRSPFQTRTFGYLGERLLNVWLRANAADLNVATRKVVNTHGEPVITKAIGVLRRKAGAAPAR